MISKNRSAIFITLLILIIASLACQLPETIPSTPTRAPITADATTTQSLPTITIHPQNSPVPITPPTTPLAIASHLISTHRIYGMVEFFNRAAASSFIPRGVNYYLLVPVLGHYEDRLLAVGVYDHARSKADFAALASAGYNTVRIILDGCTSGNSCVGIEGGQGLNPAYLDNLVDLMWLAKDADMVIIFASQGLPELGGYAAMADVDSGSTIASGRNAQFLTASGIRAAQQYWSDLLLGLASRQAPLEAVMAWELLDEQYFLADQPPFSLQSGRVSTANGKTYTMPSVSQKDALALDGLRYYIEQVHQAILSVDPTALITMGFSTPDAPNEWQEDNNRITETTASLEDSALDFFDLHANPGSGLNMAELAQNFDLSAHTNKPVILGQTGASTWVYLQAASGAIAVQDWIAASCVYGFRGWLYSSYYPSPAGLPEATWGFVDDQNTILNALSPANQPDACNVTTLPGRDLALGKAVEVSAALPDQPAQMAVDGDPTTQWSGGAFPTQWIQIDLGAFYTIGEIRLTVGQWPAGQTVHQLWVGANQDAMQLVNEFSGQEFDFDILIYTAATPLENIRYVRVVTTESPSWVSWREIEVLAPFPGTPTPTPEVSPTSIP
jgi:hypothetical protein